MNAPLDLAHRIEAFEAALDTSPETDLAQFLPARTSDHYSQVLAELVRVDLEHAWTRGRQRRLDEYRRFPDVFENRYVLEAVAFEEYRLRRRSGESVSPDSYRACFQIDTTRWPHLAESVANDDLERTCKVPIPQTPVNPDISEAEREWSSASRVLPEPGTHFLGFHLIEELGRGAFGRVYLARQGDLAARPVALKVACDMADESQKLAQLQHTNIVPIYSIHKSGPLQAACMPYFGRTTLAHVLERIGGKQIPSSGRDLKSTVSLRGQDTQKSSTPSKAPEDRIPAAPKATSEPAPLEGWKKLESLSYVEAVLWLGEQIAAGLAHAHERGILHRDLKPANVLLTDDGRPMLLDFNLAEDTKSRHSAERACVGGTLPYMAPEHLEAFSKQGPLTLDGRCDLYSLGVILFELLTGRHPWLQRGKKAREAILAMLADRRAEPPLVRQWNPAVSPATEAIIRKCLEGDPRKRYPNAEALREDLNRQLNSLSLRHAANPSRRERFRKWLRRHPRLTSSGSVAAAAMILLLLAGGGAAYSRERAHNLNAHANFLDHESAFADARLIFDDRKQSRPQLERTLGRFRAVLDHYVINDDAGDEWVQIDNVRRLTSGERDQLRTDLGEVYYLMSEIAILQSSAAPPESDDERTHLGNAERWHACAGRLASDRLPWALLDQKQGLEVFRARRSLERKPDAIDPAKMTSPRDLYLVGVRLHQRGEHTLSLPYLQKATQLDPRDFSAWFVRGTTHLALSQPDLAALCFSSCLAIRDNYAPAWLNRARAFTGLRYFELALPDFDRAIELDPNSAEAYTQRAATRIALRDLEGAEADFTRALETNAAPVRVYFLRADVRKSLGKEKLAEEDRQAGLKREPADELSWVGRAEWRLETTPEGALGDVEQALALNPFSWFALQMKAHILSEKLHKEKEAIAVLDMAVKFHPDHVAARAGRGVLLARAGERDAALRDAREALRHDTRAPNQYQVGCIYALTSVRHPEDRDEALHHLWEALKSGFGLDWVDTDADLDPLRKDEKFREMVADAKTLAAARKK